MTEQNEKIAQAALALRAAQETGVACPPLRDFVAADDIDAGYAIQEINTEQALVSGRRLTGRKIGLTSRAVQGQLGVNRPDFGMLYADMAYADGEEIPLSRLLQPKVEGEIAFVLKKDLDGDALTLAEVIGAIDYALPAIEIVDSRIADWQIKIADTVADNASSGLYVLGSRPVGLGDFDHRLCGMVIEHGGEPVSTGLGLACLGNPLNATLWLAREMVARQRPLKAGDTVLSGALGPMVTVTGPGVYELRISGLGTVQAVFTQD
ncbi:2-keto-4-pentenoate hydratase [Emcibacter sp.]|uniref:2-keto-4-pentenoate hydratase n=1 Tax=Emcibacter sp. TaxID=1979954 RepID=UPI002AA7D682|nr:fumarylacetoacetate hydrolase family protein [Emcibacter sp.]